MQSIYLTVFLYIILDLDIYIASKVKTCDQHELFQCPVNSICKENDAHDECLCKSSYEFNSKYKDANDYCIYNPRATTTSAPTTLSSSVSTPVSLPARATPVSEHHLIGGILIPIFIVLLVIGAAYGLKRLEIIRRIREYQMRRRRQRPFYEDVMMSHENDEPPLI